MSGETKKRISDLEVELFEARRDNNFLVGVMSNKPTLRDQFAMAAVTGIITRSATYFSPDEFNYFGKCAYQIADAMLAAREELQ
jgi:hypothetical protein